jgi:hypothetical protein
MSTNNHFCLFSLTALHFLFGAISPNNPKVSQLTNYLDSDHVNQFDDSFNILS